MTDLQGLTRCENSSEDFVIIPLKGQVKGESHTRQHLLHSVDITDSGIEVRSWICRLMTVHSIWGRASGPAFIDPAPGFSPPLPTSYSWKLFLLTSLNPIALFSVWISFPYHVFESFRRGSESQAVAKRVAEANRYVVNRWKKEEAAGTKKANLPSDQHYVNVSLVKDSFPCYTQAM